MVVDTELVFLLEPVDGPLSPLVDTTDTFSPMQHLHFSSSPLALLTEVITTHFHLHDSELMAGCWEMMFGDDVWRAGRTKPELVNSPSLKER
ncbi:hypothetical protein CesoFtcFv8_019543 [Champsocephalus esox]|nr:hypothetical protein CesoFtcFv8_019543 [Champsocephalus esox]